MVAQQQRHKKSTSKTIGRSKLLTILVVKEIPSCIPKETARECLKKKGQVTYIPFQQYFSQDEVSNHGDITSILATSIGRKSLERKLMNMYRKLIPMKGE